MTASKTQVGGGHYAKYAIQPAEFLIRNRIEGYEAQAILYILRHRDKNGLQDIDKAIHCLELIKEFAYEKQNP